MTRDRKVRRVKKVRRAKRDKRETKGRKAKKELLVNPRLTSTLICLAQQLLVIQLTVN